MHRRKDALVGAARMVERDQPDRRWTIRLMAVATVGLMEVSPNSRNIIPGKVFFTIDFRHPER